jgi:hypothetical protein
MFHLDLRQNPETSNDEQEVQAAASGGDGDDVVVEDVANYSSEVTSDNQKEDVGEDSNE